MKTYSFGILLFFWLWSSQQLYAQHEFFHELVLEKAILENEEWELMGEANFKHLYAEPAWRRWGLSLVGVRKIERLRILGGLNSYYTFNRDITNFLELRPWTAAQYIIPIADRLGLRQRLKYEWRFFHIEADDASQVNYGRFRYQIGVDIPLSHAEEHSWVIRPFFEWFFIRDPATFERFPNERDYGMVVVKTLKNENELYFSYKLEEFYNIDSEHGNGHIILIGYSF